VHAEADASNSAAVHPGHRPDRREEKHFPKPNMCIVSMADGCTSGGSRGVIDVLRRNERCPERGRERLRGPHAAAGKITNENGGATKRLLLSVRTDSANH
jgi:hypothetical protein